MEITIKLENTIKLIGDLFKVSEDNVKSGMKLCFREATEEQITTILQYELGKAIDTANMEKDIAHKLEKDIAEALKNNFIQSSSFIKTLANGFKAEVCWHKRHIEKNTGGDFGLVIEQPKFTINGRMLKLSDSKNRQGLLVQSKHRKYNEKWRGFTPRQKIILSKHMSYLSLLRYEYIDTENKELKSFYWNLCNNFSIKQVEDWFKYNNFQNCKTTNDIITSLGLEEIGTNDDKIIDLIIAPKKTPAMIIKIFWDSKEPRDPGPQSHINGHNNIINYSTCENVELRQYITIR